MLHNIYQFLAGSAVVKGIISYYSESGNTGSCFLEERRHGWMGKSVDHRVRLFGLDDLFQLF